MQIFIFYLSFGPNTTNFNGALKTINISLKTYAANSVQLLQYILYHH